MRKRSVIGYPETLTGGLRAFPRRGVYFHPAPDAATGFIPLHGDRLHVRSGRVHVLMIERVLRLDHAAGVLRINPRERVPGLVQVYLIDTRLSGVPFQVLDE